MNQTFGGGVLNCPFVVVKQFAPLIDDERGSTHPHLSWDCDMCVCVSPVAQPTGQAKHNAHRRDCMDYHGGCGGIINTLFIPIWWETFCGKTHSRGRRHTRLFKCDHFIISAGRAEKSNIPVDVLLFSCTVIRFLPLPRVKRPHSYSCWGRSSVVKAFPDVRVHDGTWGNKIKTHKSKPSLSYLGKWNFLQFKNLNIVNVSLNLGELKRVKQLIGSCYSLSMFFFFYAWVLAQWAANQHPLKTRQTHGYPRLFLTASSCHPLLLMCAEGII